MRKISWLRICEKKTNCVSLRSVLSWLALQSFFLQATVLSLQVPDLPWKNWQNNAPKQTLMISGLKDGVLSSRTRMDIWNLPLCSSGFCKFEMAGLNVHQMVTEYLGLYCYHSWDVFFLLKAIIWIGERQGICDDVIHKLGWGVLAHLNHCLKILFCICNPFFTIKDNKTTGNVQ